MIFIDSAPYLDANCGFAGWGIAGYVTENKDGICAKEGKGIKVF